MAVAANYVQVPLSAPSPQPFQVATNEPQGSDRDRLPYHVGALPWYPYALNISVGTPAQRQTLALSLTNRDTFVINHDICEQSGYGGVNALDCSINGSFDDEESSTFASNASDADQRAEFVSVEETLGIGDAELENGGITVASNWRLDMGVLGLHDSEPAGDPPSPGARKERRMSRIVGQLKEQGITDSRSYCIFPQRGNDTIGTIIFGGIDQSKFEGKLQRFQASAAKDQFDMHFDDDPWVPGPGYLVNVSYAILGDADGREISRYLTPVIADREPWFYQSLHVAIDPTFAFTNLPLHVVEPVYERLGNVALWNDTGMRIMPCEDIDKINGTFTLELGGHGGYLLTANLRDLVVDPEVWHMMRPETDSSGQPVEGEKSSKHCFFGIQSTTPGESFRYDEAASGVDVIGSTFLGDTYAVFDSTNLEVSFAPMSNQTDRRPDIVGFGKDGDHAPNSEFVGTRACYEAECGQRDPGDEGEDEDEDESEDGEENDEDEDEDEDIGVRLSAHTSLAISIVIGGVLLNFF